MYILLPKKEKLSWIWWWFWLVWKVKTPLSFDFLKSVKKIIKISFSEESENHSWLLWQSLGGNAGRSGVGNDASLCLPSWGHSAHSARGRAFPMQKSALHLDSQGQTIWRLFLLPNKHIKENSLRSTTKKLASLTWERHNPFHILKEKKIPQIFNICQLQVFYMGERLVVSSAAKGIVLISGH